MTVSKRSGESGRSRRQAATLAAWTCLGEASIERLPDKPWPGVAEAICTAFLEIVHHPKSVEQWRLRREHCIVAGLDVSFSSFERGVEAYPAMEANLAVLGES